jgi:hypothetical protein
MCAMRNPLPEERTEVLMGGGHAPKCKRDREAGACHRAALVGLSDAHHHFSGAGGASLL